MFDGEELVAGFDEVYVPERSVAEPVAGEVAFFESVGVLPGCGCDECGVEEVEGGDDEAAGHEGCEEVAHAEP